MIKGILSILGGAIILALVILSVDYLALLYAFLTWIAEDNGLFWGSILKWLITIDAWAFSFWGIFLMLDGGLMVFRSFGDYKTLDLFPFTKIEKIFLP